MLRTKAARALPVTANKVDVPVHLQHSCQPWRQDGWKRAETTSDNA
ncbi:hypothetical protein MHI37_03205 [Paenibacillus sp. FSL H8-0548]|nr:hypothetical protein [Paenibacillus sp. FSL H8-0548]